MKYAIILIVSFIFYSCKTVENKERLVKNIHFRSINKIDPDALQAFIEKRQHRMKKKPNIYFIFVDTLREDHANPTLMPHFSELKKNSLTFKKSYSSSTVTHSSTFGIFYANNIFNRDYLLLNKWHLGSPFLQILHRSNYHLHLYGSPWQFCIDTKNNYTNKKDLIESADSNLQSLYGLKTKSLVDFCYPNPGEKSIPQTEPKVEFTGTDEDGKIIYHQGYRDHAVTSDLIAKVASSPTSGQMFLVFYSGIHDPYSWLEFGYPQANNKLLDPSSTLYSISSPFFPWNSNWNAYRPDKPSLDFISKIKNSYSNSVRAVDYQIGRLLEHLKATGQYDEALLVVVSDHGEFLFETGQYPEGNDLRLGHCCGLYNATTDIPEVIKFPHSSFAGELPLGNHQLIFPTIFDYLGYSHFDDLKEIATGKSVFSALNTCAISFDPRGEAPQVFYVVDSESLDRVYFSVIWDNPQKLKASSMTPLYILNVDGHLKQDLRGQSPQLSWQYIQRRSYSSCMQDLFQELKKDPDFCSDFSEVNLLDQQAKFNFYKNLNQLQSEFVSPPINRYYADSEQSGATVLEDFSDKPLIVANLDKTISGQYTLSTEQMIASFTNSKYHSLIEQHDFAAKFRKLPRVVAYTFMGTDISPEQLQHRNGLCQITGDFDLNQHYHEGTPTQFISTSRSPLVAKRFAAVHFSDKSPRDGWVYVILTLGGFKDYETKEKDAVLDIKNIAIKDKNNRVEDNYINPILMSLYAEQEVAIPQGFNWKNVVAYRQVLADGKFKGEIFIREGLTQVDLSAYNQIVDYLSGKI